MKKFKLFVIFILTVFVTILTSCSFMTGSSKMYVVTYMNGEEVYQEIEHTKGDYLILPNAPDKEDYDFISQLKI